MSRRFLRAIKTRMNMRNSKAHPPIAPTISGKKDDCPFESTLLLGFITGFGVVDDTAASKIEKFKFIKNIC